MTLPAHKNNELTPTRLSHYVTWKSLIYMLGASSAIVIGGAFAASKLPLDLFKDAHAQSHNAIEDRIDFQKQVSVSVKEDVEDIKAALREYLDRINMPSASRKLKDRPMPEEIK